jgi:hypothetical protein
MGGGCLHVLRSLYSINFANCHSLVKCPIFGLDTKTNKKQEKQKASTAHSSDHHYADGLAGHKNWRTTQTTTTRIYFNI